MKPGIFFNRKNKKLIAPKSETFAELETTLSQ